MIGSARRERVLVAEHVDVVVVGHDRRRVVGRVDPGLERASPRVGDRLADELGIVVVGAGGGGQLLHEALPGESHLLGADHRRRADVHG